MAASDGRGRGKQSVHHKRVTLSDFRISDWRSENIFALGSMSPITIGRADAVQSTAEDGSSATSCHCQPVDRGRSKYAIWQVTPQGPTNASMVVMSLPASPPTRPASSAVAASWGHQCGNHNGEISANIRTISVNALYVEVSAPAQAATLDHSEADTILYGPGLWLRFKVDRSYARYEDT
jgi:hypothetical protein